jgi:ABC-type nitrate/sulfonate/bicarbonate transport system substrate-binding protein
MPFKICNELRLFDKRGIQVEFRIVPEGTGKLLDLVEQGEIHIATMVTDAFIAGKAKGRAVTMLGTYVESPLVWVVVSDPSVSYSSVSDLRRSELGRNCRFGISRPGSGSQTMAHYANLIHGLSDSGQLDFHVANHFQGLRDGEFVNERCVFDC